MSDEANATPFDPEANLDELAAEIDVVEDDDAEPDPEREQDHYLKYHFDGAATPAELSERLRAYADEVEKMAADGWTLAQTVESGWAHFRRDNHQSS